MKFKPSLLPVSAIVLLSACQQNTHTDLPRSDFKYSATVKKEANSTEWNLPELSQQEKEELVYSVKTVFNDFYVHRAQKKDEYGFDAQAEANKLSADMSSETLLRNINRIYTNVKDYHTVFLYPTPARCFIGGFPVEVKLAYETSENGNVVEKLVISQKFSKTLKSQSANENDQANFAELTPGDEILSISNLGIEDGPSGTVSAQEAIQQLQKVTMGANEDAAKTRAVQSFFSRSGAYMKPPSGRFQLTVKNAQTGTVQTYSFPWLEKISEAPFCDYLNPEDQTTKNLTGFKRAAEDWSRYEYNESFKNVYSDEVEENIEKSIMTFEGKKFAVVRINAFVPAEIESLLEADYLDSRAKIIEEVNGLRKFILDHRDEVEGLIFDVRDNGGGYGVFPQLIANAFTSEFIANMKVQPLVSQKNRDTFHNLEFSRFFKRLGTQDPLVDDNNKVLSGPISQTADEMDAILNSPDSSEKDTLLSPAARFDEDENDELPPEYNAEYKINDTEAGTSGKYPLKEIFTDKPVAVFTNSHCYSSCDIFSSIFKDHNIAKMFGETKHTGGGGANVVEWNSFAEPVVVDEKGTKTPIVPNATELAQNMRMRFAWNRIVRDYAADQTNERYIEGGGVFIPDENILKPSVVDVTTDGSEAFAKIMKDMLENASTYPLNR